MSWPPWICCPQCTKFRGGLNGDDRVPLAGQRGGVVAAACSDAEDHARLRREQVQYVAVDVGEGDAVVLLDERVGGFAIAGGAGQGVGSSLAETSERARPRGRPTGPGGILT